MKYVLLYLEPELGLLIGLLQWWDPNGGMFSDFLSNNFFLEKQKIFIIEKFSV